MMYAKAKAFVRDDFSCSPDRNFWTRALSIWRLGVLIFYFFEARYNKDGGEGGWYACATTPSRLDTDLFYNKNDGYTKHDGSRRK